ncbi:MAG: hypothetical protein ABSA83_10685 [Verrucomicrobiota bacterium]
MKIKTETATESPATPFGHRSRQGKIARLPRDVRDELNRRLLDGESGRGLIGWLKALPQVKAVLQRDFGGRPVTGQNLSEWRQGGFRDWVAQMEAADLLDDTLADSRELKGQRGSRASAPGRKGFRDKAGESVSDRVAQWFFPHYVAAARGQLAAAQTPFQRWSVLRIVCSDLASLRSKDHYVERLRIWQEKLRLDSHGVTENDFVKWARAHPGAAKLIWPDRVRLTPEEKAKKYREILGIDEPEENDQPCQGALGATVEPPVSTGGGASEEAISGPKNPT